MKIQSIFSWFFWDPNRVLFHVPIIERPIGWYGLLFVIGFIFGYFFITHMFFQKLVASQKTPMTQERLKETKNLSSLLADRILWFVVGGTIIGARLGEVFFYNWPYYREYPGEIIKVWNGGLASHGGTIGVLIALGLYFRYIKKYLPSLSFIGLLDMVCVPTAFVGFCIRVGNFFNQEILGEQTTLPWGVMFGHPADYSPIVPRHPVQLYEGACYLLLFVFLTILWEKRGLMLRPGIISGIFFIWVFGTRFLIEFLKLPQEAVVDQSFLQMGQYLSIPFILAGFWLLLYPTFDKGRVKQP